jgi:transcriptional regulator GlxA family with amidase domain
MFGGEELGRRHGSSICPSERIHAPLIAMDGAEQTLQVGRRRLQCGEHIREVVHRQHIGVEALRRHMERLPPEQSGWLAAARDPIVGAALSLLHRKPFRDWTLEGLASEAGTSRTVLSEKFARYLGYPPLTYLARWRLQLASRLLGTTRKTVQQIAVEVGYDSEASFNRAFKREFGHPPARYRKEHTGLAVRRA